VRSKEKNPAKRSSGAKKREWRKEHCKIPDLLYVDITPGESRGDFPKILIPAMFADREEKKAEIRSLKGE